MQEFYIGNEWIQHDVDIETFCTVTAPFVFFGANVAAAENIKIERVLNKTLYDTVLIKTAQKAKIMNLVGEISLHIMVEVLLELKTLGILMIDGGADNVAFVGGSLVR